MPINIRVQLQQLDMRGTSAMQMTTAWMQMLCVRAARAAVKDLFFRNGWVPEIPPTMVR